MGLKYVRVVGAVHVGRAMVRPLMCMQEVHSAWVVLPLPAGFPMRYCKVSDKAHGNEILVNGVKLPRAQH